MDTMPSWLLWILGGVACSGLVTTLTLSAYYCFNYLKHKRWF